MSTKIDLKKYLEVKKEYESVVAPIKKKAMEILKKVNRLEPIVGFNSLSISDIEIGEDGEGIVEFEGEEHWAYGGYESYRESIPSKIIFDREEEKKYFSKIIKRKIEELEEARQDKIKREKQEIEKYELLKLKFEGGE